MGLEPCFKLTAIERGVMNRALFLSVSCTLQLAILFFGLLLFATGCRRGPVLTVGEVDKAIKQEIPPGSRVPEVLHFLDSKRFGTNQFEHSTHNVDPEMISALFLYSTDEKAKNLKGTLKGFIDAGIQGTNDHAFTTSTIVARFYFDGNDQLIDYTVKEIVGK